MGQYYEIEQTNDLWSLNAGRVQTQMSVNELPLLNKTPVPFAIIDDAHSNAHGVDYICARVRSALPDI